MRQERDLLRRVARLNRAFDLIGPDDHVLVACSGGKDSWALLHLLRAYEKLVPFSFTVVAVTVDQGHPGFPAHRIRDHFNEHGFEHRIIYQDTYRVVLEKTPPGKTTCFLCSRLRRGILYRVADELGASKIALGHHREDVIETLLLNLMYAGQIKAMPPRLRSDDGRHLVIRPLAHCAEADLAAYAQAKNVPIVPCNLCGTQENSRRRQVRELLAGLEASNPDLRRSLLAAVGNVVPSHLFDRTLSAAETASSPADVDVERLRSRPGA